jgi:putative glutamine amidotransferase
MSPRVGILLSLDEGALRRGRDTFYLDASYARAVEEAGGSPLLLPIQRDPGPLLDAVDALLVPGGDDFPPERPYPSPGALTIAPERQRAFDRALLEGARARGLPVLCVCYGMQLLAHAGGGALHHHVPTDRPDALDHGGGGRSVEHGIRVESGTRLERLLGDLAVVGSRHHQAVAEPGAGLRGAARAPDGVIEALEPEAPDAPFLLAVQWHPESMDGAHRAAIYGALVEAARR